MATELEQQFFKTFGIEPTAKKYECKCGTSTTSHNLETCKSKFCDKKYCDQRHTGVYYPEITDRKLLELICIAYKTQGIELAIDDVKNEVLNNCIKYKDDIKQQIQQLFKEEE